MIRDVYSKGGISAEGKGGEEEKYGEGRRTVHGWVKVKLPR